ncbi:hypothetical protein ACYULU_08700 [Breznakiellaceae bacterium SP9]
MAGKHDYIESTYEGFDTQFKLIVDTVAANISGDQPVWTHIPAEECTKLEAAYNDWHPKHVAAELPTRSKIDVEERVEARKRDESWLRNFCQRFFYTCPNLVSDAQLEAMNLRRHDKIRTHHAAPSIIPVADAVPTASRTHTVTALNPQTNNKKKPDMTAGVAFACRVRSPDKPASDAADMPSVFQAATVRDFQYGQHQIGLVADYACGYENEGGKRGEWSNVVSVIIS